MKHNLSTLESLAKASKFRRLLHNPRKYLFGILHRIFVYPVFKKGILVETTTFFGAKMKVILPSGMDLYLLGGKSHDSEIRLAKYILNNLKPGHSFVDVGAHYGYFTLLASSIVGSGGRVHSIEASSSTFDILFQNVKDDGNITPYNLAISNKRGKLDFYEFPLLYSEYNSLDAEQYDKAKWAKKIKPEVIQIEAFPLDEFVQEQQIVPDFIKIDVEGVEDQVVLGMIKLLKSSQELVLSMEYILDENPESPHEKAVYLIIDQGYSPHRIVADGRLKPLKASEIKAYLQDAKLVSDNIVFKRTSKTRDTSAASHL